MPCPPIEILLDFAAGQIDPDESERVAAHVRDGCPACERELASVATLRRIANGDELVDPPASVLARAQRVPGQARAGGLPSLVGKIAALVFDTVRDPLPLGARSGGFQARQMLFRALDYDIDVRIAPAGGGLVRISGQVLPGPTRSLEAATDLEIALLGPTAETALSTTNELGEFDLGLRTEGDYALCVEAAEDRLVVDGLPARCS
jgi:anti-sigma factor RsiW